MTPGTIATKSGSKSLREVAHSHPSRSGLDLLKNRPPQIGGLFLAHQDDLSA